MSNTKNWKDGVFSNIAKTIVDLAKTKNILPWHIAWTTTHCNHEYGNAYHGTNLVYLTARALQQEWDCDRWLTWNQANKLGGHIRKGETKKWSYVLKWFWQKKKSSVSNDDDDEDEQFARMKYFRVYNLLQTEGIEIPESTTNGEHDMIPELDTMIAQCPNLPKILHVDSPAYAPKEDVITLPPMEKFTTPVAYYEAKLHELIHSIDIHPSRCGSAQKMLLWKEKHEYSRNEMVACLGAALVLGMVGAQQTEIQRSAAYFQHWWHLLEQDPKETVYAFQAAQRCARYLAGITFEKDGNSVSA